MALQVWQIRETIILGDVGSPPNLRKNVYEDCVVTSVKAMVGSFELDGIATRFAPFNPNCPTDMGTASFLHLEVLAKVTAGDIKCLLEWVESCPTLIEVSLEIGSRTEWIEELAPIFAKTRKAHIRFKGKSAGKNLPRLETIEEMILSIPRGWVSPRQMNKSLPACRRCTVNCASLDDADFVREWEELTHLAFYISKISDGTVAVPVVPPNIEFARIGRIDGKGSMNFSDTFSQVRAVKVLQIMGDIEGAIPLKVQETLKSLTLSDSEKAKHHDLKWLNGIGSTGFSVSLGG